MDKKKCYMCNDLIDFAKLFGIHVATKYTKTPIHEIIQKLLGTAKIIRFAPNTRVCMQCLQKFNEYDLACVTVARVETELKQTLSCIEHSSKEGIAGHSERKDAGKIADTEFSDEEAIADCWR